MKLAAQSYLFKSVNAVGILLLARPFLSFPCFVRAGKCVSSSQRYLRLKENFTYRLQSLATKAGPCLYCRHPDIISAQGKTPKNLLVLFYGPKVETYSFFREWTREETMTNNQPRCGVVFSWLLNPHSGELASGNILFSGISRLGRSTGNQGFFRNVSLRGCSKHMVHDLSLIARNAGSFGGVSFPASGPRLLSYFLDVIWGVLDAAEVS